MAMSTIGDLRQHFVSSRNTTATKTELHTLVEELTTGRVSDLTAHLGADQSELSSLDRQLQLLSKFTQTNKTTDQMLLTMQTALDNIDQNRGTASEVLLSIHQSSSTSQIEEAGRTALAGFEATVQSLNIRSGERSVFAGNETSATPLASADEMMTALNLALSGLSDSAGITAAIDTWFDDVGGGFETVGYLGDATGFMQRSIDSSQNVEVGIRADDETLRDTMKAFALGAIAGDQDIPLTTETRQTLQRQSAEALISVAAPLASAQGQLGYIQAQVEDASTRNSAQISSYSIARNTLVSSDPFDTATRLEAVQTQLETQYTLTARLSRLSLTEYLR
jgi:flagellar hook-associated protein 3 FlgL